VGTQLAKSEIEAVTVYAAGAIVVRSAELSPIEGAWPKQVRVVGLPLTLEDATVRARVEGGDGKLRAVGFRVGLEVLGDDAPTPPDEKALQEARAEVRTLESHVKDLDRLSRRVARIVPSARPARLEGEPLPPSPHAGRLALLAFQQEKLRTLASAAQESQDLLRAARERLADLEDRKQRASSVRPPRPNELRKTLLVSLGAAGSVAEGQARMVFEYRVPGARWAPAYSVHFDADWSHASLAVRAVVAQRTGEDWAGVRLKLSTAAMHSWTELPELTSLRLGRWQPPARSGWRSPPTGVEELYADYDRAAVVRKAQISLLDQIVEEGRIAPRTEVALGAPKDIVGEFTKLLESALPPPPPPSPRVPPAAPQSVPGPGEFTRMFSAPRPAPPAAAQLAGSPAEFTQTMKSAAPPLIPAQAAAPPPPPGARSSPRDVAEAPIRPAPSALDYAVLHMPGADDRGRGKLAAIELATRLEIFTQTRVRVHVNALAIVQQAHTEAMQLSSLPAAHALPSSVNGFDYAYRAELPVDVPSDGQFHSIPLLQGEAPSRLYYVTVPRVAPSVFRFSDIVNPLDAPLLPGPADIYSGGAFLMTAPLRLTPSRGVIRLGLGVEQRIKVARNTAYAEEAAGIMSGNLNLKHDIHIEIRNLLRVPAQIEVRERVPVTRDGDEQIRLAVSAKPPWEPYEPAEGSLRGGHVWKVLVKPTEVAQLHAAYTITVPAKMELAAGNRREQ